MSPSKKPLVDIVIRTRSCMGPETHRALISKSHSEVQNCRHGDQDEETIAVSWPEDVAPRLSETTYVKVNVPAADIPIVADVLLATTAYPPGGAVIDTRWSGTLFSGSVSLATRLTVL